MTRIPSQFHLHQGPSQQSVPHLFRMKELEGLDLYESSVQDIQQHLSEERFTSVDYVKFCIQRILAVNPYLECIIEVNPDAIEIAADLDDERRHVGNICNAATLCRGMTEEIDYIKFFNSH